MVDEDGKNLKIPKPISAGIILSYKCTNECRHCMYACSPKWRGDWMNLEDGRLILSRLADMLSGIYPEDTAGVSLNMGVHFTGGEPFLRFSLLLEMVRMASRFGLPGLFVETNSFWCTDDERVERMLLQLKEAGLDGILISANPFVVEHIPFDRVERAIRLSRKVFGWRNVMIYHDLFYSQLKALGIRGTITFEEYLRRMAERDPVSLHMGLGFPSLLPMGRAPYRLGHLYRRYPAERFFKESCLEELTRNWHTHIDNYHNYITGYCAGISLGDFMDDSLFEYGVDLEEHPIIGALTSKRGLEKLFKLGVEEFGYRELRDGYISKCHLCVDLRRHIALETDEFKELNPREFYRHLTG